MINPGKIKDAVFFAPTLSELRDWLDTTGWDKWDGSEFEAGVMFTFATNDNSGATVLYLRLFAEDMDYLIAQDRPAKVSLLKVVDIGNPKVEERNIWNNLSIEAQARIREVRPGQDNNFTDFRR